MEFSLFLARQGISPAGFFCCPGLEEKRWERIPWGRGRRMDPLGPLADKKFLQFFIFLTKN
jgi:hypothetical protein